MPSDPSKKPDEDTSSKQLQELGAALDHVDASLSSGSIALSAAKGIVYSMMETLGTLVGDPDLPEHSRSGYEGLLESARELRAKLTR
ncbi:MAG TPA: hypothetical protein VL598_10690 [Trinickia sp.]|jgi:hypothetical protein|uniref:hypothetical protein n=1 Tax=Trinickia sp. TaxID=2571163 RepID=UPI002BE0A53C|nr:hypothetical protein [Trinickia sp.]HTI18120.1 hypothetical protein [Trinickia sp.]